MIGVAGHDLRGSWSRPSKCRRDGCLGLRRHARGKSCRPVAARPAEPQRRMTSTAARHRRQPALPRRGRGFDPRVARGMQWSVRKRVGTCRRTTRNSGGWSWTRFGSRTPGRARATTARSRVSSTPKENAPRKRRASPHRGGSMQDRPSTPRPTPRRRRRARRRRRSPALPAMAHDLRDRRLQPPSPASKKTRARASRSWAPCRRERAPRHQPLHPRQYQRRPRRRCQRRRRPSKSRPNRP